MSDFRWQEELQAEQEAEIVQALHRIEDRCGVETALTVASHLGFTKQWRQHTNQPERKVA